MTTSISPSLAPRSGADALPSPATVSVARRSLVVAGALGLAGDVLLRHGMWGVGFPIFVATLLGAIAWLMRSRRTSWTLGACLLLLPTAFFAACFAWRDSVMLAFFNMVALLAALAALATALLRGEEWEPTGSVGAYLRGAARVSAQVLGGAGFLLTGGGRVRALPAEGRMRHAGAVVRGAVIALPLLFVFGSLFGSADPVFRRLLGDVLDLEAVVSHVMLALGVAWIAGGYLRAALLPAAAGPERTRVASLSLGLVEVGLVLGLLDLLFLSFVLVQLRYLFGGADHVALTPGLTYAEYARRGFFELVWVAVLTLPLLLAADGVLRREGRRGERVFRALAGVLVALLGVVMLSAMQRMRLYQQEYGLTETRLYASAAMGWLALVFAWFAATVLRGRRAPFAFGALLSAWGVLALLDVANPDALIADTNLARLRRGERFDPQYIYTLSADAAPRVAASFEAVHADGRCAIARYLLGRAADERGPLAWNAGRAAARRALLGRERDLRATIAVCDAEAREAAAAASAAAAAAAAARIR